MVRHPTVAKPGFPTTGGCWLFDEIEGDVSSVVPHADNSTSPHHTPPATLSPPLTRIRVLEFLRTTFFDNTTTLWRQFAAICLTLRGVTIVRALITVGPGGVGQSLNTCLIAILFGGSHGFMDVNVFFLTTSFESRLTPSRARQTPEESHIHHVGHENFRCPFFRSNRDNRVFLRSSSPAWRPPRWQPISRTPS